MDENRTNINWYPGHMTRTRRMIEKDLKMVDAVAEILDARIPVSSRNPDIRDITVNKPRIILLNKSDMADPVETKKWCDHFKSGGYTALQIECKSGKGVQAFIGALGDVLSERIESYKNKGMKNPTMRVMILGIPNVGKSTFINRISKKTKARTADRPGVTRGNQWFTISKGFEVLDTPGVLWPKFEDENVALRLAMTGAIKDQVLDIELLAVRLLDILKGMTKNEFISRYKLEDTDVKNLQSYELLGVIAKKRGMLISGGEADTQRAAIMLLDEFRAGKLGRITLETVD